MPALDYNDCRLGSRELDEAECALEDFACSGPAWTLSRCRLARGTEAQAKLGVPGPLRQGWQALLLEQGSEREGAGSRDGAADMGDPEVRDIEMASGQVGPGALFALRPREHGGRS